MHGEHNGVVDGGDGVVWARQPLQPGIVEQVEVGWQGVVGCVVVPDHRPRSPLLALPGVPHAQGNAAVPAGGQGGSVCV